MTMHDIMSILPELILIVTAMLSLIIGVFTTYRCMAIIQIITYISLILALSIVVGDHQSHQFVCNNLLIISDFTQFIKASILGAALIVAFMNHQQLKRDKLERFEYLILLLFSIVGMMFMVSANDLMVLFIGLELQSLSLYILIACKRDDAPAAESAIKYFVLGTLATVFILYGSSLLYGSIHTTGFTTITNWLEVTQGGTMAVMVGIIMITAGIAFKISLAPFHVWTPDVYQGGPTPIITFLSSVPKIAGTAIFIRLVMVVFQPSFEILGPLVMVLGILSVAIGTFAALFQQNIQRLIAYSTVSHMGYAILGLCGHPIEGVQSTLIYIIVYVITIITLFACLMSLRKDTRVICNITDLSGLSQVRPLLAGILTVVMFSLVGIPPFIGFFVKYGILLPIIKTGYYGVAFIILLLSVVGAAYYLRIIKIMYFDAPTTNTVTSEFDENISVETLSIAILGFLLIVAYIFEPGWINYSTLKATTALYQSP